MDNEFKEWNKENNNKITEIETTDIYIIFILNEIKIRIQKKREYYTINIIEGNEYLWIDELNIESIRKKLSITEIMNNIIKNISNNKKEKELKIELTDTLDNFNIKEQKEIYKLRQNKKTSKSQINITSNIINQFSHEIISEMIIKSYMEVWNNNSFKNCIDIVDNNIYHWRLYLNKFNDNINDTLNIINNKYGYNHITIDLMFSDTLYPYYPPIIKILRPKLNKSLMYRISNSRLIQFEYWDPITKIENIIKKIIEIINKWGSIDIDNELNDYIKYPMGAYLSIEDDLFKLTSYINISDIDEIDKNEQYIKYIEYNNKLTHNNTILPTQQKYKSGTGFGNYKTQKWDIDNYLQIQQIKDNKICEILTEILIKIENSNDHFCQIVKSVADSLLIKFIKHQLNTTTLLEMETHKQLFDLIFNILFYFVTDNSIYIYDDSETNNLYDILLKLNKISEISLKIDSQNNFANKIFILFELINPEYKKYIDNKNINIINISNNNIIINNNIKDLLNSEYINQLSKYNFDSIIIKNNNYYYDSYSNNLTTPMLIRLSNEIPTLEKSLPIHRDSSIFICIDDIHTYVMRSLITGPPDTPYANGCFIFDICIPNNYPNECPMINFRNSGRKRMNPNLYEDGKVCLSLLNTYIGPTPDKSEIWNSKTSTLSQILISIQGQILNDSPYFNEPTFETQMGSSFGIIKNIEYNNNVRLYTMEHTILDLLEKPLLYPQFTNIINTHFKLKKDEILSVCEKWVNDNTDYMTSFINENNSNLEYLNKLSNLEYLNKKYILIFNKIKKKLSLI